MAKAARIMSGRFSLEVAGDGRSILDSFRTLPALEIRKILVCSCFTKGRYTHIRPKKESGNMRELQWDYRGKRGPCLCPNIVGLRAD